MFNFFRKPELKTIKKVFQVRPNQIGCLFYRNVLQKVLEAGVYPVEDSREEPLYSFLTIDMAHRFVQVVNQEVLSKDNVALRFSYYISYIVGNVEQLLKNINVANALNYNGIADPNMFSQIEQRLTYTTHTHIRQLIGNINSDDLSEQRSQIVDFKTEEMETKASEMGIKLLNVSLRDLTFPKNIQDLFNKQLESKVRSKTDLENARTAVATARALKNASEIMKGDENIRYLQYMEMLQKIANKGNHTFVLGDVTNLPKPK